METSCQNHTNVKCTSHRKSTQISNCKFCFKAGFPSRHPTFPDPDCYFVKSLNEHLRIVYCDDDGKLMMLKMNTHFTLIFLGLQEELDVLRAKFEKMDKERQELRQQNEKLESRVRIIAI